MDATNELKSRIFAEIIKYTSSEDFKCLEANNPAFAETIKNLKPEDITLGDYPHFIDVQYSGIAKFNYCFHGNYNNKYTNSVDFITGQYYRILLNKDGKFILDECLYKDPKYDVAGCFSVSQIWRYAAEQQALITPEYKTLTCCSNEQSICNAVKKEIEDRLDDELSARTNAYVSSLQLTRIHQEDVKNDITIPLCAIAANIKDENGQDHFKIIGTYSNFNDNEKIDINISVPKNNSKKKSAILKWIFGLLPAAIIAGVIIYFIVIK